MDLDNINAVLGFNEFTQTNQMYWVSRVFYNLFVGNQFCSLVFLFGNSATCHEFVAFLTNSAARHVTVTVTHILNSYASMFNAI